MLHVSCHIRFRKEQMQGGCELLLCWQRVEISVQIVCCFKNCQEKYSLEKHRKWPFGSDCLFSEAPLIPLKTLDPHPEKILHGQNSNFRALQMPCNGRKWEGLLKGCECQQCFDKVESCRKHVMWLEFHLWPFFHYTTQILFFFFFFHGRVSPSNSSGQL